MMTNKLRWVLPTVIAIVGMVAASRHLDATETSSEIWKKHLGQKPPFTAVLYATGPLAKEHPYNPKTFGTIRGFAPAYAAKSNAVLLYARNYSPGLETLAKRIDAFTDAQAKHKDSCIVLFDRKGAQLGSYTADELTQRVDELSKIAEQAELSKLSIAVACNASTHLVSDSSDAIGVVLIRPNADPKEFAEVVWHKEVDGSLLDRSVMDEVETAMREHLQASAIPK